MRPIRRNDLSPRVEMLPLIDVIFLLLTFFIYSLIVMVNANVLPVKLAPLARGNTPEVASIEAITVDGQGRIFVNREAKTWDELVTYLGTLAERESAPPLFIALEAEGSTDRGPTLLRVIEQARAVGLDEIILVGGRE